ncbi:MAG: WD40 repeat domain-containing protein [Planctomycetota bacterium]
MKPTNAEANKLESLYSKHLSQVGQANAWQAWRRATREFLENPEHSRGISLETLDWWAFEKPRGKDTASGEPTSLGGWSAGSEYVEILDFHTGPPSFSTAIETDELLNSYELDSERKPPGLRLQQNVFLSRPKGCDSDSQLDDFAKGIAEDRAWDGVTCISGVRGCGKSTIINRIEWYCKNWIESNGRPLLVRFDIGMAFEPERFARDLADQLCREARNFYRQKPIVAFLPGVTELNLAFANIARWFQSNIMWASILTLLFLALIGTAHFSESGRTSGSGEPVVILKDGQNFYQVPASSFAFLGGDKGDSSVLLGWHNQRARYAAISPHGGRALIVFDGGKAEIRDTAHGSLVSIIDGNLRNLSAVAFSPDDNRLVTATGGSIATVWDVPTGAKIGVCAGHQGAILHATFASSLSDANRSLITTSIDKTARLWSEDCRSEWAVLGGHTGAIRFADFTRNGNRVALASEDGLASIWDLALKRLPSRIGFARGHNGGVTSVRFNPDGSKVLTTSRDGMAYLWNASKPELPLKTFRGHLGPVLTGVFSETGEEIATTSTDNTTRVWSIVDGEVQGVIRGFQGPISRVFAVTNTQGPARLGKPVTAEMVSRIGAIRSQSTQPSVRNSIRLPLFGKLPAAEVYVLLLSVIGLVGLGFVYGSRRAWRMTGALVAGRLPLLGRLARERLDPIRQYIVVGLLSVPILIGLRAVYYWIFPATPPGQHPQLAPAFLGEIVTYSFTWFALPKLESSLLVPFTVSFVALALAILAIPRWWEDYVRFQRITRQLQSQNDTRFIPVPYVGSFLASVLPKSDDHEELDKISMPFLQQRTKNILQECVNSFGRVVILVDDADILPTECFHLLMRIMRPITKVPGSACVIAVPSFFFDVLKSKTLGDAHSTIRECHYLGDPKLFLPGADAPFKLRQQQLPAKAKSSRTSTAPDNQQDLGQEAITRHDFHIRVAETLCSRLRIPLSDKVDPEELTRSKFVRNALSLWDFHPESDSKSQLNDDESYFLEATDGSKREIIRSLEARLPIPPLTDSVVAAQLGGLGTPQMEENRALRIENGRISFEEMENAFHCDAQTRADLKKARKELGVE